MRMLQSRRIADAFDTLNSMYEGCGAQEVRPWGGSWGT